MLLRFWIWSIRDLIKNAPHTRAIFPRSAELARYPVRCDRSQRTAPEWVSFGLENCGTDSWIFKSEGHCWRHSLRDVKPDRNSLNESVFFGGVATWVNGFIEKFKLVDFRWHTIIPSWRIYWWRLTMRLHGVCLQLNCYSRIIAAMFGVERSA